MIDKKPPKFNAKDDLGDGFDEEEETVTSHPSHDTMDDDLEGADNDGEIAAAAMVAAQKRNGMLMTYGIGAVFFLGAAFLMWPHFKHYFVSSAPTQTALYNPVPGEARKNYFASGTSAGAGASPPSDTAGGSTDTAPPVGAHAVEPSPGDTGTGIPSVVPPPPLGTPAPASTSAPTATLPTVAASTGQTQAVAPSSASNPVLPSVAPPVTTSNPSSSEATVPAPSEVDTKIAALQTTVDKLQSTTDKLGATQDATDGQLKQIQATLTALQAQIAQISAKQTTAPRSRAREANGGASHARSWELRSAVPGLALISHPGSNDLQRVSEGDLVSGLGKITSISEKEGHWVVQGTEGSVSGE